MRLVLILFSFAIVFTLLLVVVAHQASAGSADAPELTDPAGDCAVAYGGLYLDITSAWIDNEDADSFDVHLALEGWEDEVAEGAGYAVQFTHQGIQWGVIAFYSPAVEGGWVFWTGAATLADVSETVDAPGSVDIEAATITITFDKALFPHEDPNDTTLQGIHALAVDVRPAYPFILGADGLGTEPDGKWVLCDEASTDATYAFTHGGHSVEHAMPGNATAEASDNAGASADPDASSADPQLAPASVSPQGGEKGTPLAPLVALGALAIAALRRGRS